MEPEGSHHVHKSLPPVPDLNQMQSTSSHHLYWTYILILSSLLYLGLLSGHFPSGFLTKTQYKFLFSPMCVSISFLLDLI
jgi:hypothetical protein